MFLSRLACRTPTRLCIQPHMCSNFQCTPNAGRLSLRGVLVPVRWPKQRCTPRPGVNGWRINSALQPQNSGPLTHSPGGPPFTGRGKSVGSIPGGTTIVKPLGPEEVVTLLFVLQVVPTHATVQSTESVQHHGSCILLSSVWQWHHIQWLQSLC